jgi:hypothetical protein
MLGAQAELSYASPSRALEEGKRTQGNICVSGCLASMPAVHAWIRRARKRFLAQVHCHLGSCIPEPNDKTCPMETLFARFGLKLLAHNMKVHDPVKFVEQQGVVLESAKGSRPSLAEAVAGEPIRGSWWGHKKGRAIFSATRAVRNSPDVLVCHFLDGKVTYIHRRLWPAIVRLADSLDTTKLAAIHEKHTPSGAHKAHLIPFPKWVPREIQQMAKELSEQQAICQLGECVDVARSRKLAPSGRSPT